MIFSSNVQTAFKGGALFVCLFFGESDKLEKRRGRIQKKVIDAGI